MTNKVYKSAQGKMVDLGTIILKNEHVRAVGNMKVNARGDKLDSLNQVVDTRTERIQRRNERTSVNSIVPQSNANQAKSQSQAPKTKNKNKKIVDPSTKINSNQTEPEPVSLADPAPSVKSIASRPPMETRQVVAPAPQPVSPPVVQNRTQVPEVNLNNPARPAKSPVAGTVSSTGQGGGLAGAIARSREIKQELDRSRRQQAQDKGLRKI